MKPKPLETRFPTVSRGRQDLPLRLVERTRILTYSDSHLCFCALLSCIFKVHYVLERTTGRIELGCSVACCTSGGSAKLGDIVSHRTAWLVGPIFTPRLIDVQGRIKKVMQADEEVGKVAVASPVLICKLCRAAMPLNRQWPMW